MKFKEIQKLCIVLLFYLISNQISEKDEKYKIKLNSEYSTHYKFIAFSSITIFEMEIDNILLFKLDTNNKDQYFITNIKDYENIYIYFNADYSSGEFYTKFISENEMKTIDKNITEYYFDSQDTTRKNIFLFEKKNDFLIINVKYSSGY